MAEPSLSLEEQIEAAKKRLPPPRVDLSWLDKSPKRRVRRKPYVKAKRKRLGRPAPAVQVPDQTEVAAVRSSFIDSFRRHQRHTEKEPRNHLFVTTPHPGLQNAHPSPGMILTGDVHYSKAVWSNPRMEYRMISRYCGKIKAVVFDWAGTVVDSGVFAPARAFTKIFEMEGVEVTDEEVRGPMGAHKRVHIVKMLEMDGVGKRWKAKHGKPATEEDIDRMYDNFLPLQIEALKEYANVIQGVPDTIKHLREEYGLKIGSSTGFTGPIMDALKPMAAAQGFAPDYCGTSDLVKEGRPSPNLLFLNAINLNVNPIQAIVKVDDTVGGIKEGLSAGCWAVGIAMTGNHMGATEEELKTMPKEEFNTRLQRSYNVLSAGGAHYVIDTVNDLPAVIDDINRRLAMGERP